MKLRRYSVTHGADRSSMELFWTRRGAERMRDRKLYRGVYNVWVWSENRWRSLDDPYITLYEPGYGVSPARSSSGPFDY